MCAKSTKVHYNFDKMARKTAEVCLLEIDDHKLSRY